jgi:hypothetical protein
MIIICPHCNISIIVEEVRCGIFRCGIYKDTFKQVDPHLSKEECDKLGDTIYGCGKPFQIKNNEVMKCDYI